MIDYKHNLIQVINKIDINEIKKIVSLIRKAENVYIIGNGGSHSIAEHFAIDLIKFGHKRAYTFNSSLITMTGNDYGYDHSFSWLIDHYSKEKDLVIGLSTSGKSANVLRSLGGRASTNVLICGLGGKDFVKNVSASIILHSTKTQILEDVFMIICHMIALQIRKDK